MFRRFSTIDQVTNVVLASTKIESHIASCLLENLKLPTRDNGSDFVPLFFRHLDDQFHGLIVGFHHFIIVDWWLSYKIIGRHILLCSRCHPLKPPSQMLRSLPPDEHLTPSYLRITSLRLKGISPSHVYDCFCNLLHNAIHHSMWKSHDLPFCLCWRCLCISRWVKSRSLGLGKDRFWNSRHKWLFFMGTNTLPFHVLSHLGTSLCKYYHLPKSLSLARSANHSATLLCMCIFQRHWLESPSLKLCYVWLVPHNNNHDWKCSDLHHEQNRLRKFPHSNFHLWKLAILDHEATNPSIILYT